MIPFLSVLFISLVLFLFVPFHLKLNGHYEKVFAGSFTISWLWDLVGFEYSKDEIKILIAGRAIFRKVRKEKLRTKPHKKEQKTRSKSRLISHFPFVFETAKQFFRSLCPEGRIKGVVGLGDPAATGMLMGIVAACFSFLPLPFLTVVPEFEEEKFIVEGWLTVRILLISIFALCIKFVLSREGREIIQEL